MSDAIAVLNAGSSSLKFSLFHDGESVLEAGIHGQVEGIETAPHFIARDPAGRTIAEERWAPAGDAGHDEALERCMAFMTRELGADRLSGVGHRVAHGGLMFAEPVRVSDSVLQALRAYIPLAPLHQPHHLAPIAGLLKSRPGLPQVACFDTAFHRSKPKVAEYFALPTELHDAGVQRYGFHGLSYEFIAGELARLDPLAAAGRTVVLHLGSGASMCALRGGRSIETTMAFTPLDGLPMGTRCGSLDPGVLLFLLQERGMDGPGIEKLLYHGAGLFGVSGVSSDMRELLASAEPKAALAVELFVYHIVRELGSLAAALQGLDCMVFTAGIGENSAEIRSRVCGSLAWLGVELDEARNRSGLGRISSDGSRVAVWALATNEELMIADHTWRLIHGGL